MLQSAVGMTHDLRSDLWWTIPLRILLGQFYTQKWTISTLVVKLSVSAIFTPRWTATPDVTLRTLAPFVREHSLLSTVHNIFKMEVEQPLTFVITWPNLTCSTHLNRFQIKSWYYDKLRSGYFRVIGVGYAVVLQRHLVDKPKGGFWVEGKFQDNVSS